MKKRLRKKFLKKYYFIKNLQGFFFEEKFKIKLFRNKRNYQFFIKGEHGIFTKITVKKGKS